MATDIFGNVTQVGGAWKLDGAVLTIEGGQDLVARSIAITYQRAIEQINPINQDKKYLIAGDARGTIQLSAVIGPSTGIKAFIDKYADICEIGTNVLTIKPSGAEDCEGNANPVEFICEGAVMTGVGLNVDKTAGGNLVLLSVTMEFLSLQMK